MDLKRCKISSINTNSQEKREIRDLQDGVRSSFLEAGFSIRSELWPIARRDGAIALNLSRAAAQMKLYPDGVLQLRILGLRMFLPSN